MPSSSSRPCPETLANSVASRLRTTDQRLLRQTKEFDDITELIDPVLQDKCASLQAGCLSPSARERTRQQIELLQQAMQKAEAGAELAASEHATNLPVLKAWQSGLHPLAPPPPAPPPPAPAPPIPPPHLLAPIGDVVALLGPNGERLVQFTLVGQSGLIKLQKQQAVFDLFLILAEDDGPDERGLIRWKTEAEVRAALDAQGIRTSITTLVGRLRDSFGSQLSRNHVERRHGRLRLYCWSRYAGSRPPADA